MIPMGHEFLPTMKMGFCFGDFSRGYVFIFFFSMNQECGIPSQIGWRLGTPGKFGEYTNT